MNLITVKMTLVLFMLCSGFVHSTFVLNRLRIFRIPEQHMLNRMSWHESLQKCEEENGSFVTVYDEDDINFLSRLVENIRDDVWLGLRRSRYNVSTWSNGVPYIFNISNVTVTDGSQICEGIYNNTWTGFNCSEEKHFMCYKGDNYTLIENEKKWCQAQLYCRKYFTDLVSISNERQNQQVIDKGKNKTFWIGLMHDEWEWEDDSCSTYREWNSPKSSGNCTIYRSSLKGWDCDDCRITMCSKGHVRIKVINKSLTWEEAFQYCEVNHIGLLQIEDEQDQEAVQQWISHVGFNSSFWIGLRQSRVFGFWIWHNRTVTYSNWRNDRAPEMPMSNHCGAISNTDYKWSDENCWLKLPFLCEEEISFMKK